MLAWTIQKINQNESPTINYIIYKIVIDYKIVDKTY